MEEFVSTKQAADELGFTQRWIQKQIQSGRIPSLIIGRDRFIRRADLEQYKRARATPPTPPGK